MARTMTRAFTGAPRRASGVVGVRGGQFPQHALGQEVLELRGCWFG
ncbi:hypothetical protein [Streptomyces sp. NPDC015125]